MSNESEKSDSGNVPTWMVTFADLMALMMTFFVLLYSFSKVDQERYRAMVNSMGEGFNGVQWIKRHITGKDTIGPQPGIVSPPGQQKPSPIKQPETRKKITQNDRLTDLLDKELSQEIAEGKIHIERQDGNIIIRFPESVSFPSGSDTLSSSFIPVIHRISDILGKAKGRIVIAGYTDDRPISTSRFRSNWELSTARAVTVAHYLLETKKVDPNKIVVSGYADTHPLVPNTSEENRVKNRRVEISVIADKPGN